MNFNQPRIHNLPCQNQRTLVRELFPSRRPVSARRLFTDSTVSQDFLQLSAVYEEILTGSQKNITSFTLECPGECCICTDSLSVDDKLECGHWVHKQCIRENVKHRGPDGCKCPFCRQDLPLKNYC
jgi:hypothetical protein